MAKFRVAIIGAGLGGLLHALSLEKLSPDVEVNVYDSVAELKTDIGGGIMLHRRVWAIIEALGLNQALSHEKPAAPKSTDDNAGEKKKPKPAMLVRGRKGDQPEGVEFYTFGTGGEKIRAYHRNELQGKLAEQLKSSRLHLSKRLVAYVQTQDAGRPIELSFEDGSTATCDILVGADGVKSVVRQQLFADLAAEADARGDAEEATKLRGCRAPVWSGGINYRTVISEETLRARSAPDEPQVLQDSLIYCGKGWTAVGYPIGQGRINFSGSSFQPDKAGTVYDGPWVTTTGQADVKRVYEHAEPALAQLLDAIENVSVWSIHMVKKLPTYVHGRVAIIGDAAHAMTPFLAGGAGQAFEDGYTLARLLAHPKVTPDTLLAALQVYDSVRRPFSQEVAEASFDLGCALNLCTGPFADVTPEQSATGKVVTDEQLKELGKEIERKTAWTTATTVAENCEVAIRQLEEHLG